jgi:hypothetical protein
MFSGYYRLFLVNISLHFVLKQVFFLPSFLSVFTHHMPYHIPVFMKATVLHYSLFTEAVHSHTSTSLLVSQSTAHTAVAPHFHTKCLKEDQHTRL